MPTEKYDWREALLSDTELLTDQVGTATFEIVMPKALLAILVEAASDRGASVDNYMRRAIYAFAAHDHGVAASRLFALDPEVRGLGAFAEDPEKYGRWEISRLRKGKEPHVHASLELQRLRAERVARKSKSQSQGGAE